MSIPRSQEDSWTKEMAKWEMRPVMVNGTYIEPIHHTRGGRGDMPFQPYGTPGKMLYKAESADGGPRICDTLIVKDEAEERIALGRGWSDGQEAAIDAVHARDLEFAKLAANRAHQDRWMSERARAEAAAIDETTAAHLPAIPPTAIKPRSHKKQKPAVVTATTAEG